MNGGLEDRNFRRPLGVGVQRNKKTRFRPAVEVCSYECPQMRCFKTLDIPASLTAKEGEIIGGLLPTSAHSKGHNQDGSLPSPLSFFPARADLLWILLSMETKAKGLWDIYRSEGIHLVSPANHEVWLTGFINLGFVIGIKDLVRVCKTDFRSGNERVVLT